MLKMQEIIRPIEQEFEVFKELFDASLQSTNPLLKEVITYIKQRRGKLMRPILVLLTARAFGEIGTSTYHAASSLELLHTASLVHDDVVDESDKRRGQKSVNAVYDNKVSVLVGDYLLSTSLKEASLTGNIKIVNAISKLGQDLSEGEIVQLSTISDSVFSEEIYFEVIRKKTAALFATSAELGACSVDSTDEMVKIACLLGELIGIAFQIKDDIFDYYTSDTLGKPTGNDMREGKLTLPALYVLNAFEDDEMKKVALRIRSLEAAPTEIDGFIQYVKEKGGIDYAHKVMMDYRNKALALLPSTVPSEIKDSLTAYIDYVINREK
ncbi:MAG: polyprenyl synthetase family protein [Bacteroides sp.]|nr:polyprenyl synthetase family protein [Bacteroides sp.]